MAPKQPLPAVASSLTPAPQPAWECPWNSGMDSYLELPLQRVATVCLIVPCCLMLLAFPRGLMVHSFHRPPPSRPGSPPPHRPMVPLTTASSLCPHGTHSNILYQPRSLNSVVDCLSQALVSKVTCRVDYEVLATLQTSSPNVQALRAPDISMHLADMPLSPDTPALL